MRFAGNPAAVVVLEEFLPDASMQAIAAENNLAETAFLVAAGTEHHLRWFTPTVEVKLCGHATLAPARDRPRRPSLRLHKPLLRPGERHSRGPGDRWRTLHAHSLLGKPARQDGLSRLPSLQPRRRGDLRITWRARQVERLMRLLPRRRNTDLTLRGFRRWQNAGHQACRQHSGAPARAPFLSMLSTWRLV